MGTLIVTEFMTVDGVAQAPGGPEEDPSDDFPFGGWQMPLIGAEDESLIFDQAKSMDALLLGRRTYEIFEDYWPSAPQEFEFTGLINRVPKYVASRTLANPLGWDGASVLDGDLAESVAGLKDRYEEVHVIGSLDLVHSLLSQGLVDRLQLWVYPLVLGRGKRVFASGEVPSALRLVDSAIFPNGTVKLDFATAGEPVIGNFSDEELLDRLT
ncbi:MAG TPA: dihydrofolate reductase family protein [Glycomyces sp.]|nr:dihydrofolate reductase family protein [Glycomyces sp.]